MKTLSARLAHHRGKSKVCPDRRLYMFVAEHGGWINFRIVLVEKSSIREKEYWRKELGTTLNVIASYSGVPYGLGRKAYDAKIRATKHMCECGGTYTCQHKSEHLRSKKHLQYKAQIDEPYLYGIDFSQSLF